MNLLSAETATKTFNLLSIGQRGVGKTVFLAGSYAELHSDSQTSGSQGLWFECQDTQVQENIEKILSYVIQTGQYPPPTIKITNFNFSLLKRHSQQATQKLCDFIWWDIPGEICDIHNSDFKKLIATSHGCCVFIDAYALVHNKAYLEVLKYIILQVQAVAILVHLNRLKYAFALILTKCDLLEPGSLSRQQIEEGLQPLTTRLDAVKANYQMFYSSIPIVHIEGIPTLKAKGAADPFLWLVWELSLAHNSGWMSKLLPSRLQPRQAGVNGGLQSMSTSAAKASAVKKIFGLYLSPTARKNLILLLAIFGLVGTIGFFSVDYKQIFQGEPNKIDTLENRE